MDIFTQENGSFQGLVPDHHNKQTDFVRVQVGVVVLRLRMAEVFEEPLSHTSPWVAKASVLRMPHGRSKVQALFNKGCKPAEGRCLLSACDEASPKNLSEMQTTQCFVMPT